MLSSSDITVPAPEGLPPFSLLGVRLSFLDTFMNEWCGGKDNLTELSTTAVCEKYVIPRTTKSLCEHLLEDHPEAVGTATCFISHAWAYNFLDTIHAVQHHFMNKSEPDVFIWFDLFSNSQHDTSIRPFEWWSGTFVNAISKIGSVLMVLHPWNDPITLTRAWCVFELYACATSKSSFSIAIPPSKLSEFRTSLREDPDSFYNMLANVRSAKSQAFKPEDRLAIHHAISVIGFHTLDQMVFGVLSDWMVQTFQAQITSAEREGNEVELVEWQSRLIKLYGDLGKDDSMYPLYVDCLERKTLLYGADNTDTLRMKCRLAAWYTAQNKHEVAEPILEQCYDRHMQAHGMDHPGTLDMMNNLALVYIVREKFELGNRLLVECLEQRKRSLGESHSDTIATMSNLAFSYGQQKRFDEAERLYVEALDRQTKIDGQEHPSRISSLFALGQFYEKAGNTAKAEEIYIESVDKFRKVLGDDHPNTLNAMIFLGKLWTDAKKYDKAKQLLTERRDISVQAYGADHPETLVADQYIKYMKNHQARTELMEWNAIMNREREVRAKAAGEVVRPKHVCDEGCVTVVTESDETTTHTRTTHSDGSVSTGWQNTRYMREKTHYIRRENLLVDVPFYRNPRSKNPLWMGWR
ncbi:Kinesin light chain 3 [Rhizophlyctis rosea]|nr:Kinesin light chain 3 [Rhizophlyctis rosea]